MALPRSWPPRLVASWPITSSMTRAGMPASSSQAPAVYHADPSEHAGGSLHDWFGRTFGRGHWKRDR